MVLTMLTDTLVANSRYVDIIHDLHYHGAEFEKTKAKLQYHYGGQSNPGTPIKNQQTTCSQFHLEHLFQMISKFFLFFPEVGVKR